MWAAQEFARADAQESVQSADPQTAPADEPLTPTPGANISIFIVGVVVVVDHSRETIDGEI